MENACMISRMGKVIPVEVHPYIEYDFLQMNIKYGLWFYDNTENNDVKQAYIDLISCYAKNEFEIKTDIIQNLIDACEKIPEVQKFIRKYESEILNSYEKDLDEKSVLDVLVKESNQEFMRVRYGGVYKTKPGVREIYFRISSSGFNWYNIIWQYVYDNLPYIDYVTIVRDIASTGSGEFYRGKHGIYNLMPIDDFISETGNPVIEWKNKLPSVRKQLALGGTLKSLENLPMNPQRIKEEYEFIVEAENKNPRFWYDIDYALNAILDNHPINKVILDYVKIVN